MLIDFLRLFLNPLVLALLIAAFASTALGEATDASIIVAIVIEQHARGQIATAYVVARMDGWPTGPRIRNLLATEGCRWH